MTTRTSGRFDHRLEALDARMVLSAEGMPLPAADARVVVADEAFLNGASDATDEGGEDATGDIAQAAASTAVVNDGGWYGEDPGHPGMGFRPVEVAPTYGRAGEYAGEAPLLTEEDFLIDVPELTAPTEEQVVSADAPLPEAPAAPVVAEPVVSGSIVPQAEAPGIYWIEAPVAGVEDGVAAVATAHVVIVSTFVGN